MENLFQWVIIVVMALAIAYIGPLTVKQLVNLLKEKTMVYKFDTSFQTGINTMFHNFGNGIFVRTHLLTGNSTLYNDGKVVKEYKDMSLDEYDVVIYMAAQMAQYKKNRQLQTADGSLVSTSKN